MNKIQSVLFCCDLNSVRSPMAEGICKKLYGTSMFIQSAGVASNAEIDPFAVEVCEELGIKLRKHRSRSFKEMEAWGDDISSFDLIIALSPASQRHALEYTRFFSLNIEYWQTLDPTDIGDRRTMKLDAYRTTRDQLLKNIKKRFQSIVAK
ncbi:MAG: low molecular weight phosphatase family protein [Rhodobacteraceae bacterium]|nr:MAG: low molecular weight phosphatase family protein [Paracoccaceae bacterium]